MHGWLVSVAPFYKVQAFPCGPTAGCEQAAGKHMKDWFERESPGSDRGGLDTEVSGRAWGLEIGGRAQSRKRRFAGKQWSLRGLKPRRKTSADGKCPGSETGGRVAVQRTKSRGV
jgi:hypothetical protein